MNKKILYIIAASALVLLAACSSEAPKTIDMMHFQFKDIGYAVPDSWVDNTDDPDMYVHASGDDSTSIAVMTSDVDPNKMTLFEYFDSQNIEYEPIQAQADGVTLDGAEYTNDDGDLIHTYYYVSPAGDPYMIHVYLFDKSTKNEEAFLKSIKLNE